MAGGVGGGGGHRNGDRHSVMRRTWLRRSDGKKGRWLMFTSDTGGGGGD